MNRQIYLGDSKYFKIFIGKRVLKSEIFRSKGNIPVYSANVFEPFGFLQKSNVTDFCHHHLLWGIDGDFRFNLVRKGTEFATTDHCGVLTILDQDIVPEYILHVLESNRRELGFDRTLRSSLANMKKVLVEIPVDESRKFDKKVQQDIVLKYLFLRKIKEELKNEIEGLSEILIDIDVPKREIMILRISDIFDLSKTTNNSRFTKAFINQNKGNIPVYSASKKSDETSYGLVKDNLPNVKYFENILTWNIDGSIGKAFFRTERFSLSEKVIPLLLKSKWNNTIDYGYVKYVLEKKAVERGFAFSHKAGKSRIKDIEIEFPAINRNGQTTPDFDKQKQLAKQYQQLYDIRERLIQNVQDLHDISVQI